MPHPLKHLFLLVLLMALGLPGSRPVLAGPPDLSAQERDWLTRNPEKLVLYYNTEFPPIEFASPTGRFIGLGADVIDAVEKRLGVTFIKQPCADWNRHLEALERGDCAIAPTIVRNAERERFAFFTTAYAEVPVVIITGRTRTGTVTLEDLAGRRVAVVSGYATEKYLADRAAGRFRVVSVKNVIEGLRELSFGQVDALVENLAVAAYYIDQQGLPNLRVAGSTDYSFAWSIGVSRRYPLLYSAVQKALEAIPPAELEVMRKRWISLEAPVGLDPETRRLLKLAALFALLMVLSLAGITFILKRRLKKRVASLRESEELFRGLISTIPDLVLRTALDGTIVYVNEVDFPLHRGEGREAVIGRNIFDYLAPEDRARALEITQRMFEAYQGIQEYRVLDPDGGAIACEVNGDVLRAADGNPFGMVYVVRDVTARKAMEEDRKKLQDQLLQAQKMESVGRLAGGVAHDFNNMLGAIIGNAELALSEPGAAGRLQRNLEQILQAAKRSANLTRQLLAFARKQTIVPKILDLNETVEGMLKMLRRLIGEDIDLAWMPQTGLGKVLMDPSQVDQILVNLCINAKDAIGDHGRITIETANAVLDESASAVQGDVSPGDYVLLAVGDSGCGMDAEMQARIFDPFFTTKGVGEGTGLGLATVYGIVKQNHGAIQLSSEPGRGTVFKILIPRQPDPVDPIDREKPPAEIPHGRGETILLVEDESAILEMGTVMLRSLDYKVIPASAPGEALRLAEAHPDRIDLLITDVIMPEMNGKELAARLRERFVGMECLFMSGYPADVIAPSGVLEEGVQFIQKPFSLAELAAKVRRVL